MTKTFTLPTLEGYLRTLSGLVSYHEAHPEDAERTGKGGEEGDVVDRLVETIRVGLEKDGKRGEEGNGEIVGGWPLVLMMIKKKV